MIGPMTTPAARPRICDNYGISIRRDGSWWHQGAPITRHNMVKLFARQITRDAEGRYWLETPAERGEITVEDLPFRITGWRAATDGIELQTDCEDWLLLSAAHPMRLDTIDGMAMPAVQVRGDLWARLTRAVYYDLAAIAVADAQDARWLGIASGGQFHRLGAAA